MHAAHRDKKASDVCIAHLTLRSGRRRTQVRVQNVEVAGLRAEERAVSAGAGRRRLVVGNPPPERSLRAAGKRARETRCERGRGSRRGSKRRRTADRLELVAEVLAAGGGRVEAAGGRAAGGERGRTSGGGAARSRRRRRTPTRSSVSTQSGAGGMGIGSGIG